MFSQSRLQPLRQLFDRILPPAWATSSTLLVLVGMRLGAEWIHGRTLTDDPYEQMLWEGVELLWSRTLLAVVTFAGLMYGVWRALGRNPLRSANYRHWLLRSPWQSPEPLPWGNVLPAPQDLVVLAALVLMCWGAAPRPWLPAAVAVGIYTMSLAWQVLAWRPSIPLYSIPWLIAVGVYFREAPFVWVLALVGSLAAASWLMHCVLRDLRHIKRPFIDCSREVPEIVDEHRPLGAPWTALAPHPVGPVIPWPHALLISVSAGLAFWSLRFDHTNQGLKILYIPFLFGLTKWSLAGRTARPPLSLRGRWKTRRLVIPSFDAAKLSALAIVLSGTATSWLVVRLPLFTSTQIGCVVAVCGSLTLVLPPSLDQLRLTSEGRLNLGRAAARRPQLPAKWS